MKRLLFLLMATLLVLTACGKAGEKEEDTSNDGTYFKDDVAQTETVKVKVTDTKIIPIGEEGNGGGKQPIIVFWYEATNLSDEGINPVTAWSSVFSAEQEDELQVGGAFDEDHFKTQFEEIQKDETLESSITYTLENSETPVSLIAKDNDSEIGEKEYKVK